MGIILDPNKQLVRIKLYYVEEEKKHGNVVFHFVKSDDELTSWKRKGYIPADEIPSTAKPNNPSSTKTPGEPIVNTSTPSRIIQSIETFWKRLSWGDQNSILAQCLKNIPGPSGNIITELDGIRYRDLKLKKCLQRWNVMDGNNQPVPISNETLDNLVPEVAQELLSAFERITEPTEDELKN